jgi:hypothetical protein
VSVASRTVLIVCIAALALVGIAVAAARVGPSAGRAGWLAAAPAAAAGAGAFFALQAVARQPWSRDPVPARARGVLFIAGLAAVPFLARLPAAAELALLAAGAGYLTTTLAVIARRAWALRAARARA